MSNKNLPSITLNQLARMSSIKELAIKADDAILPTTKAKYAKQALENLFDLTQELIIQNGHLMLCTGMEKASEGDDA